MSNKFPNGAPAIFRSNMEQASLLLIRFYSFQVFGKGFSLISPEFRFFQILKMFKIMTFIFIVFEKFF